MKNEHVKQHIEVAIDRARERVSDRIDALDGKLRDQLDFQKVAGEHAPQIIAAGVAFGFLVGLGVPKVLLRSIQIGVPVWLAVRVVRKRREQAAESALPPPTINPPL